MLSTQEKEILTCIANGEKDKIKLSEKTKKEMREINQTLIQLGSKRLIEVELPNGQPIIKTITQRGRDLLEDNTWLFEKE